MGEKTGIAWADSTRNFWSGCTKVGPGCDGCYAEAFNRWTRGKNEETGEAKNWGLGAQRVSHVEGAVRDLRRWNSQSAAMGRRRSVFINTFSDTFDNEAPQVWRDSIWEAVRENGWIDFLLVTKRVGNVVKMVPEQWMREGFPANARLLITVVNQEEADRDVPKLLALPCKNGISYEPALGPVHWGMWLSRTNMPGLNLLPGFRDPLPGIEWVIVGGESKQAGHPARPFVIGWARETIAQCRAAGVAVFVKQLGSFVVDRNDAGFDGCTPGGWPDMDPANLDHDINGFKEEYQGADCRVRLRDPAGEDPAEWPEDLRVREIPQ